MLNKRADKLELLRIAEAVALEKSIDKELIISSLSIDFSKATASAILNNSSLSALLFNIFLFVPKKMGKCPFCKIQQCIWNIIKIFFNSTETI